MGETLVLFDGNALVHRAFHALPPLTTSKGELVNAVYGFAQMIFKAVGDIKPQCWAIAFDRAAPTFRHIEFEAYKAQRARPPEGLYEQFGRVRQLVEALGIPVYEAEGYEADDVLGTLARQAEERGLDVVIVSGDADTMQLVGPRVRVLTPGKVFTQTTLYDEAAVQEKYGLSPEQLPDYKGLCGDPSDNIPGVPGVGTKTAARLLAEFGTLEELYAHLDEVNPRLRELLEKHEAEARKGKWLATIVEEAPVQLDLERSRIASYDRAAVVDLLRELEFKSLLNRLPATGSQQPTAGRAQASPSVAQPVQAQGPVVPVQISLFAEGPEQNLEAEAEPPIEVKGPAPVADLEIKPLGQYWIINSPEALEQLCANLAQSFGFAVDLETDNIDAMRAGLVGIAVSLQPEQAYYIPVGHRAPSHDGDFVGQLPIDDVLSRLRPILENPDIPKYAHNGKYEMIVLGRHGVNLRGLSFDTMVAAYLLEPSQRTFNLTDVAWHRLGVELTPISKLIGKGKKSAMTMADVPIPAAALYAGAHADATYRLMRVLGPELRKEGLWDLFTSVEMPLVPVLADMELAGVGLDVDYLRVLSQQLSERIASIEMSIYQAVGHRFNINSTQQLGSVLFDELKLPAARKTKTGYSTDAEVLEELRGQHPVVDMVLEYRQLQKLKSTYVDALPAMINPETRRLHTSFNQAGTVTGRLSSSDPNLQNIPIRTELGRQVRRAFVVGHEGARLLAADYSQIELRILAHVSNDPRLLAAFAVDADIHAATAAEVFGVPLSSVTPEMRRVAKTVNFGVIYGMSDYGLATSAGLSRHESAQFIANYFGKYSGVATYVEGVKRQASELGYVSTALGRRRYIPEINVPHRLARMAAERMAVNMPIQGTAADIIKLAMIRIYQALQERGLRSKMILQVHDELVFEVPVDELEEMKTLVRSVMESAMPLAVRLKVDVKVGDNWRDIQSQPEVEMLEAIQENDGLAVEELAGSEPSAGPGGEPGHSTDGSEGSGA